MSLAGQTALAAAISYSELFEVPQGGASNPRNLRQGPQDAQNHKKSEKKKVQNHIRAAKLCPHEDLKYCLLIDDVGHIRSIDLNQKVPKLKDNL